MIFRDTKLEDSYFNRDVEKAFMTASKQLFEQKTRPSTLISNEVGNMYTSSVYGGLASFISALVELFNMQFFKTISLFTLITHFIFIIFKRYENLYLYLIFVCPLNFLIKLINLFYFYLYIFVYISLWKLPSLLTQNI